MSAAAATATYRAATGTATRPPNAGFLYPAASAGTSWLTFNLSVSCPILKLASDGAVRYGETSPTNFQQHGRRVSCSTCSSVFRVLVDGCAKRGKCFEGSAAEMLAKMDATAWVVILGIM